jgi:hypothetical protein
MPSVTLTIPPAKYAEFKTYFLRTHPNQTEESAAPLTDDQWIKHRIFLFAKGAYIKGKRAERDESPVAFDDDIITEG